MRNKEFNQEFGSRATGCTLRLVKEYFGRGKIVIGDSFFSSVNTAKALL